MTDYKYDPAFIPAPHLPEMLHRAGYEPAVEYPQIWYALTRGNSGAVQDRTRRWYLHRDLLPKLAERLRLTYHHPPIVPPAPKPAPAPSPAPTVWESYDDETKEAAESYVDALSQGSGFAFQDLDRIALTCAVAGYLDLIADTGHRYWSTRVVEALRGINAMSTKVITRGNRVAAPQFTPIIPPDKLGRDETIRSYTPAQPRLAPVEDDSVSEDL